MQAAPLFKYSPLAIHIPKPQASETLVLSKLLVEGSNRRIYHVDRHAGAVSGVHLSFGSRVRMFFPCGLAESGSSPPR